MGRRPFWSFYPSVKSTSLLFAEHPLYHPLYQQIYPTVYDQFTEDLFHFQKISHALQMSLDFQILLTLPLLSLTCTHIESKTLLAKSFSFIKFRSLEFLLAVMGCYHLRIFLAMSWGLRKDMLSEMEIKTFSTDLIFISS